VAERPGKQDPRFDINSPIKAAGAWKSQGFPTPGTPSIFESAPLFRIEVELDARTNPFELPFLPDYDGLNTNKGTQALEGAWFKFEVSATHRKGFTPALIYPGLFATPISAFVQGTMPTPVRANALAGIFSLQHFPKYQKIVFKLLSTKLAQTSSLSTVLDRETQTLYSMRIHPSLVIRCRRYTLTLVLGYIVTSTQRRLPAFLLYTLPANYTVTLGCRSLGWSVRDWSRTPPTYPALLRTWIAPLQTVGPLHIAFANDIIAQGGKLYIYNPPPGKINKVALSKRTELRLALGTGNGRNDTGIVAVVENRNLSPSRTWLLTGDCNYTHIEPSLAPKNPIAVVVPHHGANLNGGTAAPNHSAV
jgi:hypothetical protein